MDVRSAYLSAIEIAARLLDEPAVEAEWDGPSALAGWRVSGLCGHLARAVTTVEEYLDGDPSPKGEAVGPGRYFAAVPAATDLDSPLHRAIRARGDEMAAQGRAGLHRVVVATHDRLVTRLASERGDRLMSVAGGVVLTLDDYLATRLVELVVHGDDLAVSVTLPTPAFSPEALGVVIDTLVAAARDRHGDLAVVHALARRERDEAEALRVL